jgi:2-oxo-4-hydroxy-4-carboxy-5-ureidoimidazoline decarboxylase
MTLDQLNRLSEADARASLEPCCGAGRWVERMVIDRPFESLDELLEISDRIWEECDVDDYLEAIGRHPRIAGPEGTEATIASRLADGHARYAEKFGHGFIACVTGKSGAELCALLEARMGNTPEHEIGVAAAEQNKITRQRLKKLLA